MSKKISLFYKEELSFKEKFFFLMDLLITNQTSSKTECIIFFIIFYLQMISGFFSQQIKVFNKEFTSDKILFNFERILRISDLLINNYSEFKYIIIIIFIVLIIFIIYFIILCSKINKNSLYSYEELIINSYIKFFIYIEFNIILDLVFSNFCFGKNETNPYFKEISCKITDNFKIISISVILLIISVILNFFIQTFYFDSYFLSSSFFSRVTCNYETYLTLNSIFYSVFLIQANYLGKEIFLLYNFIISIFFFVFYFKNYLFYDKITNTIAGLFHILYLWTSFFCLFFAYINFNEKGIIYLIVSCIILYFYFKLKIRLENKIFLDTPFYKITNKSHFLYYLKNLIDKINLAEQNPEEKAILTGIMYIHSIECPNPNCISKTKNKLYLPMTGEWSDRTKPFIDDKVFLINFITIVMNYFIECKYYSPDMIINLSFYYLEVIGNYCLSMLYYKKSKEMKLNYQEMFSLERLKIKISKTLNKKFKNPKEECSSIEDLDITVYFKYSDLSENFIDEMNKDINLSLEFWKIFHDSLIDSKKQIDFNEIFFLTNKIKLTKEKIEKLWGNLISIYFGVNGLYELYCEYVEHINDDDLKKKALESLKRKSENFSEKIGLNYYSILFKKDTGIIIINGNKDKEGLIEKANFEVERMFKYQYGELKGKNLNILMPKSYSKYHSQFISRFFEIGEKIILDKKILKTFGLDKDNSIIMLNIIVKLFPTLNENVYFCGILSKENIDDIILLDSSFNIQGMSLKIMKILKLDNSLLFQENEIPFYVICKQFVNFYKIFIQNNKNKKVKAKRKQTIESSFFEENINKEENEEKKEEENEKLEMNDNIEINENIELEYEIFIPKFLMKYSLFTNNNFKEENNKFLTPENLKETYDENNESLDNFTESDLLVNENNNDSSSFVSDKKEIKKNNIKPNNKLPNQQFETTNPTPTPNPNSYFITIHKVPEHKTLINDLKQNTIHMSSIQSSKIEIKRMNEEKIFYQKILKYKELFQKGKFEELEKYIDVINLNSFSNPFKFNFTFDRIVFGNNNMTYMIRCIDNKNDCIYSDEETIENITPQIIQYKKDKADAIKPLFEILDEEKKSIINQVDNFYLLSTQNSKFQKLLYRNQEDIKRTSFIHGKKKGAIDDENGSQTSQSGYNSNLLKKNRIEEIKNNLLNNTSHFWALKFMKIIVFWISLSTIIFGIMYLKHFMLIFKNLKDVNLLNIDLFLNLNLMNNLIGSLVSLKALYENKKNNEIYKFNSYIEDNEEYFNTLKKKSYKWYTDIISRFGYLEHFIGNFLSKENLNKYIWNLENITYNYNGLTETETFPSGLSQTMSDINSLLLNEFFSLHLSKINENSQFYLDYILYLSIENSCLNIIPSQFKKIQFIPKLFQEYNNSSKKKAIEYLFVFAFTYVILSVLYWIILYLINENMEELLEKICKIKLEKIEEILKKLESFNLLLKQYLEKKQLFQNKNKSDSQIIEINQTQNDHFNTKLDTSNELDVFNSNSKKIIKLNLLKTSYIYSISLLVVTIAFLIPIVLLTLLMIKSSNELINVEKNIFGKIIYSSASMLDIKCIISECDCNLNNIVNYVQIINFSEIQKIYQGIGVFNELKTFYNQKYLLNACKAIFEENTTEYENCSNNELIKSANNTDSLIKLIDVFFKQLKELKNLYNNENYTLINGNIVKFKSIYLYESKYFKNLETIFYNYVSPVADIFAQIFDNSLLEYLTYKKKLVFILFICFMILISLLCFHNIIFYVGKVINFLKTSRFILKIIPTSMISGTQELEIWIEENK